MSRPSNAELSRRVGRLTAENSRQAETIADLRAERNDATVDRLAELQKENELLRAQVKDLTEAKDNAECDYRRMHVISGTSRKRANRWKLAAMASMAIIINDQGVAW